MPGYCESVGGFWGGEFHSNLDRQMCSQITAIRGEYEAVLVAETTQGRSSGQVAVSARSVLATVDAIDDQLEAGETCLTLGAADPPSFLVGAGLLGIAYRIAGGTWRFPAATDAAYVQLCTEWSDRLVQLNSELQQQLTWANDAGRAEVVGSLIGNVETAAEQASSVVDVRPATWCENAPEVCSALKAAGWLLVAYIGFQALKELK